MSPVPLRRLCWALLALGAGCTAAKAQLEILAAEEGLQRAEGYEAEKLAVYEYIMAEQYLDKAREQAGSSSYRLADELARRSALWSDRAIIFVETRGRDEIDLRGLTDVAPPDAVPPPEPRDPLDDLDDEITIPISEDPR